MTRKHGMLDNFVYVADTLQVDSSVVVGMPLHSLQKAQDYCKDCTERFGVVPQTRLYSVSDLGRTAFADNFLYYVSDDYASYFSDSVPSTKMPNDALCDYIDPNSADGCNIDLSDITVDVAAIPQPSKNYIFSRRCRELALRIFLPLLMLFALPMMNSCKDEPDNPTPPTPQPDPTDTIVIPTKEKVFDVDWNEEPYDFAPSADSIKKYAGNPEYKYIFINVMNKGSPIDQEGMPCDGFAARKFKRARDTLQTRIDINPAKVRGSGTIIVGGPGAASLPETASALVGMRAVDSAWYVANGWKIAHRYEQH